LGNVIYRGSVKNIEQYRPPTENHFGSGSMHFHSDGYSIFDYGTMPWEIPRKGEDLCATTHEFARILDDNGLPSHFTGAATEGDRKIGIHLARMLGYDEIKPGESIIYRIPIECIFSSIVTPVSSLHRRLRNGKAEPGDYGLDHVPERDEVVTLPETRATFSTKIEEGGDVYRTLEEMATVSGLVGNEGERLKELTLAGAEALFEACDRTDLRLADGKFEFVMGPGRNLLFADTCYGWDENRFLYELPNSRWVDLSKQLPRNAYNIEGDWKRELKVAQKAHPTDPTQWPTPPDLGEDVRKVFQRACHAVKCELREETDGPNLGETAQLVADTLDRLKDQYGRDETGAEL